MTSVWLPTSTDNSRNCQDCGQPGVLVLTAQDGTETTGRRCRACFLRAIDEMSLRAEIEHGAYPSPFARYDWKRERDQDAHVI